MIGEFQGEYRFLSNFWYAEVEFGGLFYSTVEHAYQAAKTFDTVERSRIQAAHSPGEAKRIGRTVALRSDWEGTKLNVMEYLLRQKFARPDLREKLLATGEEYLREGNTWGDAFWGVDTRRRLGHNHLGRLLMKIREELRANPQQSVVGDA